MAERVQPGSQAAQGQSRELPAAYSALLLATRR
jgi:hypothetical protein